MALSALEMNTISRAIAASQKVVRELQPILAELNILYDSAGGLKTTITQSGLDQVASFSGLTKGQLDDGCFALTATLRSAILNAYTALAELAARG